MGFPEEERENGSPAEGAGIRTGGGMHTDYDPKDLQSALLYMRNKFPIEALAKRPARMYDILCDLAPTLKRHAKVLRRMGEAGLLRELHFVAEHGDAEQKFRAVMKARYWLTDYLGLSAERADDYMNVLNVVYRLDADLSKLTEAERAPALEPQSDAPTKVPAKSADAATKFPSVILYAGRTGKQWWRNLRWTLDGDGVLTISGCGYMKNCAYDESGGTTNIPWRNHLWNVRAVVIESCVTSIGDNAFRRCVNLNSVRIPDSVTFIGERAFSGCVNLTRIRVPDSVMFIGKHAFQGCETLTSVRLPRSLSAISDGLFDSCANLTEIAIPDGVASVGAWAFYDCTRLRNVRIPDGAASIGWYAFRNCASLKRVSVPTGIEIALDAFDDGAELLVR